MSRRLVLTVFAVVAVTVLGVVLAAGLRTREAPAAASAGPLSQVRDQPAPPLHGMTLDGSTFDLATLRGSVVLVNVWASWCSPCRQELPALAEAQHRWRGFSVIGIDMRDNAESARGLLTELGVTQLRSLSDPAGTTAVTWGARGVPESFLVDREGRVRWWAQGAVDAAWLEQRVPPLVDA
jgi:cytochrome c biogenesis protein CcmG/thiol:disulfide interchange protein DsbE